MRSLLAFLRTLVLPAGAGPTVSRIELDGVNGEIRIYQGATLVGRWRPTDFAVGANLALASSKLVLQPAASPAAATVLFLDPPDSGSLGSMLPAQMFADLQGSDDTPFLGISGPRIGTETGAPRIDLYGSNATSGWIRRINLAPSAGVDNAGAYVDVPFDASKTTDFRIGGVTAPRGLIPGKSFVATADSSGYSSDTDTDFAVSNIPVVAGRTIRFTLDSRYTISAAGEWALELKVNGTKIGEVGYIDDAAARAGRVHGQCLWTPSTTQATDDVVVTANEIGGTSTLTFIAAANTPRILTTEDIGKLT